jgi:hypothetical protein
MALIHAMTETAVANEALSLLRQSAITNVESDTDHVAKVLRKHFAGVRDALLRRYPWNFAEREAVLTALPDVPTGVWQYAYALPNKPYCLTARKLHREHHRHWKVRGRTLVSNIGPSVTLIYTALVDDVSQWDALFRMAFSTALAARCAPEIAKDLELEQLKSAQAQDALAAAFPTDSAEGTADEVEECEIITARR